MSRAIASGILVMLLLGGSGPAMAQKSGGVLRMPHGDSPASMSIHEEATIVAEGPMMAVFNNLVVFDQQIAQNRLDQVEGAQRTPPVRGHPVPQVVAELRVEHRVPIRCPSRWLRRRS